MKASRNAAAKVATSAATKNRRGASNKGKSPSKDMRRLRRPAGKTTTTHLTPKKYIEALGTFDLDPATPVGPMPWETATKRLTPVEDGLATPWSKQDFVWLNPPFGRGIDKWLAKLDAHGHGFALVPDNTDTAWFQDHIGHGKSVRLVFNPRSRIKFCNQQGKQHAQGLPGGIAVVAYGEEAERRLLKAVKDGKLVGTVFKPLRIEVVAAKNTVAANDGKVAA